MQNRTAKPGWNTLQISRALGLAEQLELERRLTETYHLLQPLDFQPPKSDLMTIKNNIALTVEALEKPTQPANNPNAQAATLHAQKLRVALEELVTKLKDYNKNKRTIENAYEEARPDALEYLTKRKRTMLPKALEHSAKRVKKEDTISSADKAVEKTLIDRQITLQNQFKELEKSVRPKLEQELKALEAETKKISSELGITRPTQQKLG